MDTASASAPRAAEIEGELAPRQAVSKGLLSKSSRQYNTVSERKFDRMSTSSEDSFVRVPGEQDLISALKAHSGRRRESIPEITKKVTSTPDFVSLKPLKALRGSFHQMFVSTTSTTSTTSLKRLCLEVGQIPLLKKWQNQAAVLALVPRLQLGLLRPVTCCTWVHNSSYLPVGPI